MTVLALDLIQALEFAALTNRGGVQPWMRWEGWRLHVGCDVCASDGAAASCWGAQRCHRYESGCGCAECAERQARDEAAGRGVLRALTHAGKVRAASGGVLTEQSKERSIG